MSASTLSRKPVDSPLLSSHNNSANENLEPDFDHQGLFCIVNMKINTH